MTKVRVKKAATYKRKCIGGPYNGKTIAMTTDSTLIFRIKRFHGQYIVHDSKYVKWKPVK